MNDIGDVIEIKNLSKVIELHENSKGGFGEILLDIFRKKENNSFTVLNHIDISVPFLKTLGIIGRNGSGKSSLLKLIANITYPSDGYVRTKGRLAAILDIGSGFHPELTGYENIYFYGKILGMTKKEIDQRKDEIISFSELESFIGRPVKHYSNGMYLRLAFSIAVHSHVDIILFDEVLTVGDVSFNIKCFQKINELKKNTNIVLVSHNMEDITRVCDVCLWLDKGEAKMIGEPHEVVSKYIESTLNLTVIESEKGLNNINDRFLDLEQNGITLSRFDLFREKDDILDSVFDYDEEFYLSFSIIVQSDRSFELIPTLIIVDQNNNNVLASASVYQGEPYLVIKENGRFDVKCLMPKRFLNRGLYRISLYIFDKGQELVFQAQNVSYFKIAISDEMLNSYLKKSSLSISSSLNWSINPSIPLQ
jgi:ABC-type polysaccharide/polyol phosphate transport system ATPase subunit